MGTESGSPGSGPHAPDVSASHTRDHSDTPDPLDDFSRVSDEAIEKRIILRAVLGTSLAACLSLLVYLSLDILKEGHPRYLPFLLGFCGILVCVLYLVLVRVDAGRWSLLHPMVRPKITSVYRRLRNNPPEFILLILLDTALGLAILFSSSSGWIFQEDGLYGLGLLLGGGLFANAIVIQALGRGSVKEDES